MNDSIDTEADILYWDSYMDYLEFTQKDLRTLKIEGYLNIEELF